MILTYKTIKVRWEDADELAKIINGLNATQIISIKRCIPEATDTAYWSTIHYEYVVT